MTTKSSFASSDDLSSNQFNMIQKSNDVNRICFYLDAGRGQTWEMGIWLQNLHLDRTKKIDT